MTEQKPGPRYWGSMAPKAKKEFFNAVTTPAAAGDGKIATIRMYGPIDSWGGWWGISSKDVGGVLDSLPDTVEQIILRVNSPGGEVFEGVTILNMLRAHKAKVLAVVDGLAGSAASFIVAGCDESVMSPGTQMVIHKTSGFTFGNSIDLRKDAEVLDVLDSSIKSIYIAKAGDKDWDALMAAETWFNADDTVAIGLADRVAVIPDAGEAHTAGEEDEPDVVVILPGDDDEPEDRTSLARITPIRERAVAQLSNSTHPKPPSSTEPVEPNRKKVATMADNTLADGIRERLGVTDAAASDEVLLAALDEALAEGADTATPVVPEGTQLIDSGVLASLQSDAAAGRQARDEQDSTRREGIVTNAINEGRITPASRDKWLDALGKDEDGAAALIASLAKNTIPVSELGRSDGAEVSAADAEYFAMFPDERPTEKGA